MNGIETTLIGNLGKDVEVRFSTKGKPWARFSVAVSRITSDASGEKKENTTWVNCKLFGDQAENLASSAQKGNRVMLTGHFESESWKDSNGEEKRDMVFVVQEVGASLRWASASLTRNASNGGGGYSNGSANGAANGSAKRSAPADNGFAAPADGGFSDEENPFL
jgi:single-strand DNA-binding protein